MLDFKGATREKNGSSRNKNVKMDVWPHNGTRQDRIRNNCVRGDIGVALFEENMIKKPVKVVQTHAKKPTGIASEESRLHDFQPREKEDRETEKNIGGSWCCAIHVTDLTWWDKTFVVVIVVPLDKLL